MTIRFPLPELRPSAQGARPIRRPRGAIAPHVEPTVSGAGVAPNRVRSSRSPTDEAPTQALPSARPQYRAEDLVDMTAMVDIVFFLLIFFMVTSLQGICASIGMPAPDPQKVSSKGQRTVADFENDADYLIVRIDQDDTVWVEDQEMPSEQDLLVKLREALDKAQARVGCWCWATATLATPPWSASSTRETRWDWRTCDWRSRTNREAETGG